MTVLATKSLSIQDLIFHSSGPLPDLKMGLAASSEGSLNQEQLQLVQDSWRIIMENPEENGIAIFKTFLERHNYYSEFEKFKGIPLDKLPESKTFRNHSLAIIRAINHITENINNEGKLKTLLLQLGRQHGRHNIKENQFRELKLVILDILKSAFNLGDDCLNAWDKTFDLAFAFVFQGLEGK